VNDFDTEKYFAPSFENERKIVSFELWIAIALMFGTAGWYFIIRFVKNAWF